MELITVGHTQSQERLRELVTKSSLPSTLLFLGPSGIGKNHLAKALAGYILCEEPPATTLQGCGQCKICKLIAHGNLPDLLGIDGANPGDGITEQVRTVLRALSLQAHSAGARVIIINQADMLGTSASNVLLKSLEEPRPNTYFILVAENGAKIPITVRSRCSIWTFSPLSTHELAEVATRLLGKAPDQELLEISDGSMEKLLLFSEHGSFANQLQKELLQIANGDISRLVDLASALAKDKEAISANLMLIQLIVRKIMLKNPLDPRWAQTLLNLLAASRLIEDRHLGATHVLICALAPIGNADGDITNSAGAGYGAELSKI